MEAFVIVLVAVLALVAILIYGTVNKTPWGINFSRVTCPNCGTQMPVVRKPTSGRQAMWGGFTCPNCGTEMDKWGRRTSSPPGG